MVSWPAIHWHHDIRMAAVGMALEAGYPHRQGINVNPQKKISGDPQPLFRSDTHARSAGSPDSGRSLNVFWNLVSGFCWLVQCVGMKLYYVYHTNHLVIMIRCDLPNSFWLIFEQFYLRRGRCQKVWLKGCVGLLAYFTGGVVGSSWLFPNFLCICPVSKF